ncbi:phosphotransferase [Halorubellus sp. PRR65]|uniref:phosphotransferase family protein n=1 Tax=Halorubellus sp. PRR65 TaxID=3098148 RepID=UPI002B2611ED|nr:phosphotransferase [Halorubellus sp. PRR65]
MTDEWTRADADVSDDAVREMVRELRPGWTVERVERAADGTDFVATLDVSTSTGDRRVVLKATTATWVDAEVARAEPRLLERVGRETTTPVPDVYGYRDAHDALPAPFYLLEYVPGAALEGEADVLDEPAVRRLLRAAGENLAALHDLGTLPGVGTVGVRDGDLAVLDTDDNPRAENGLEKAREDCLAAIDSLDDGGFFPGVTDDRERFADLQSVLRAHVERTVPTLPAADDPRYCHWDYRYGNLLVDVDTGATNAVLDWANLSAAEPASNLASAEFNLLDAGDPDDATLAARRRTFRDAYAAARDDGFAFTDAVRERMAFYEFGERVGAMACFGLWHQDASPSERAAIEADHRAFVRERCDDP